MLLVISEGNLTALACDFSEHELITQKPLDYPQSFFWQFMSDRKSVFSASKHLQECSHSNIHLRLHYSVKTVQPQEQVKAL